MAGKVTAKISNKTKENTVGVIVAVIVLLIVFLVLAISFKISSDRRSKNLGTKTTETSVDKLVDNAENSSVKAYVERGLTADEKHYSIEMTVSANNRTIRVLKGYEQVQDKSEGLPNNLEAYSAFLQGLEKNKFTAWREDKSGLSFREACPTEKGYRFSLREGSSVIFDRWFEYCDGQRYGDYGGKVNDTYTLFKNQFPNYSKVTSGISF